MIRAMVTEGGDDLIRRGWELLSAADWGGARACFERAHALDGRAEALDGLSRALHFQGEYERAIEMTEQVFVAYRRLDRTVEAADRARWLAFLHGAINGNMAIAMGWMARAETLLQETDECAAHGWLAVDQAPLTDDPAERERLAGVALALAHRFGDIELHYDATALLGASYVSRGRVREGMRLLDEAMTAVCAGEVAGIVPAADICCRLLGACETAMDVARAEQWISALGGFGAWSDFVSPICRAHYGGILMEVGRWTDAEDELVAAIRIFEQGYRAMRLGPLVKLAELRVRQGRLEEGRRLLEGHESHPAARRTHAAIALANGELALAEDLLGLCLDGPAGAYPAYARELDSLVQVRLLRGDLAGAGATLERLAVLVAAADDPRTVAFAERATGRVAVARDDDDGASRLQASLQAFAALDLPLEAARTQLELARAIAGRAPAAAAEEARLALTAFERLGASTDADAASALLRRLGVAGRAWPRRAGVLTARETQVLALLGSGCSNAEIAERLYISRRTAEHHVARILAKLNLSNRSAAAAYAVGERSKDQ